MSDIERVKEFTFRKINEGIKEVKQGEYKNKQYVSSVADLRNTVLEKKIKEDGYEEWPAVYCFFDAHGIVQYIGKAKQRVWQRMWQHVKDSKDNTYSDDWKILILYPRLWVRDHEFMEKKLIGKFNPALNKNLRTDT